MIFQFLIGDAQPSQTIFKDSIRSYEHSVLVCYEYRKRSFKTSLVFFHDAMVAM